MTDDSLLASVVVAVRGDPRARRLLASLAAQTLPADCFEVIVVENGSTGLGDLDGAHGITRYVHRARANTAAARNAGLAAARGRYLLLTDADCIATARLGREDDRAPWRRRDMRGGRADRQA